MADVLIRQAGPEDLDDIYRIERLCFPDPWSRDSLKAELTENPRAFYVVAEHSGQVVGYAGLWWIIDEGHITNVAVKPGFRNRHIADGILNVLIDFTAGRGLRHHTLEVNENNKAAINLYTKHGFRASGIRPGYYRIPGKEPEAALIMWRHADGTDL